MAPIYKYLFMYGFELNMLFAAVEEEADKLHFVMFNLQNNGFATKISLPQCGRGSVTGAPASVSPRRWAAVFVNTSVAVGRD